MNILFTVFATSISFLGSNVNPTTATVEELRQLVVELQGEVANLKNQDNAWLSDQRSDQIRDLVHEVLADADTRASLQGTNTTAGYDGGAYIQSTDGNWKLKIGGQLQARWLYNKAGGQDSEHGFEQRRTKLKFSGHVVDPSWVYKIVTTWSRDDNNQSVTEDAWAGKKFDDGSWFKFGQFKQRFLRENVVSSSKQLTVERSMLNNAFTYGWSQGIEYGWKNDDMKLLVQYTDGPGQSNTPALSSPTNAWVARAEFRFGDASWKDFEYLTSKVGAKTGWLIGVAYQNYDTDTGTFEYGNAKANESNGWTVDVSYRADGWNVFGYAVETTGKNTTNGDEVDSSGWLIQGGFMANDNVELFAQYQEGEVSGSNMDMDALRVGFNYWPTAGSNTLKWTTDLAWAGDTLVNTSSGSLATPSADWVSSGNGWRADTGSEKDQMLLRTQLQILF
jgi:hypothetical protein